MNNSIISANEIFVLSLSWLIKSPDKIKIFLFSVFVMIQKLRAFLVEHVTS